MLPRAALSLATCAVVHAAISFTATIPDVDATPITLNFPILDCVGSGHGSLALRADYRDHLARVRARQAYLAFRCASVLAELEAWIVQNPSRQYGCCRSRRISASSTFEDTAFSTMTCLPTSTVMVQEEAI